MPMFQQRHFEAIAEVIRNLPTECNRGIVTADFIALFCDDNPKFKTRLFLAACGMGVPPRVDPQVIEARS